MILTFTLRWSIESTFEETRAHLGIETQRQWSDVAIERPDHSTFVVYLQFAYLDWNMPSFF